MTAPQRLATTFRLPSNPHLRRLAEGVPGYQDELDVAAQADAWLRNMQAVPPVPAGLDPRISGDISQEGLDAVRAHTQAVADQDADRKLVQQAKQQALAHASSAFASSINRLLATLNDELTSLLAAVGDIAADTADQAISLGVEADWKRARDTADDIESLYGASEELYLHTASRTYWQSARPVLGGDDWASLSRIRNLDEVFPSWRNPAAAQRINVDGTKDRAEPWPSDKTGRLLWFRRNGAQLWIPTLPQLDALFREKRDALNPPQEQRPQPGLLNQTPRTTSDGYYDRTVTPLEIAARPTELDLEGEPTR